MKKTVYKIHPAIGIARVGNSPDSFYLAPETAQGMPLECTPDGNSIPDAQGNEQTVSSFRDAQGRIRRQAARFRIFVYDEANPQGRELQIGDMIQGQDSQGKLVDVRWGCYLANKKAVWYDFQQTDGEHGYAPDHPLRNPGITQHDLRQKLIIDPGAQQVYCGNYKKYTRAEFTQGKNETSSQCFPPPLSPNSITTLGSMQGFITPQNNLRLCVLGGFGNSGSMNTGFGQPVIEHYANNEGWFDDTSDGPVTAKLIFWDEVDNQYRYQEVDFPAWVITGYPRYAPGIADMVTMDDLVYDLSVRDFGYNPYLYGPGNYDTARPVDAANPDELNRWRIQKKTYNPDYYPYFYRDIWPILTRPYYMQFTTAVLAISNDAHEIGPRGDFNLEYMSQPPSAGQDPYRQMREYVFGILRLPGEENVLQNRHVPPNTSLWLKELMPLLNGDNPLSNTAPSKFLRLTDTMLFLLKQWAEGKFINEKQEDIQPKSDDFWYGPGYQIDRGVLANMLGGAFCPGAEACWVMRNPALYKTPYRIRVNPNFTPHMTSPGGGVVGKGPALGDEQLPPMPDLNQGQDFDAGMEPGDVTKYGPQPWQSDFNECTNNITDVTFENWNVLYPDSVGDSLLSRNQKTLNVLWWPSHRPMQVYVQQANAPDAAHKVTYSYPQLDWARGIPQTHAGDLMMVSAWTRLGFIVASDGSDPSAPLFYEVEAQGPPETH